MDEHDNKVISLLERQHKDSGGKMVISPDGFHYVSFHFSGPEESAHQEKEELELTEKRSYIFKLLLEHHKDAARINHYYVPGNRLKEFLNSLSQRPGKLLEIKPYIPDTMA